MGIQAEDFSQHHGQVLDPSAMCKGVYSQQQMRRPYGAHWPSHGNHFPTPQGGLLAAIPAGLWEGLQCTAEAMLSPHCIPPFSPSKH